MNEATRYIGRFDHPDGTPEVLNAHASVEDAVQEAEQRGQPGDRYEVHAFEPGADRGRLVAEGVIGAA